MLPAVLSPPGNISAQGKGHRRLEVIVAVVAISVQVDWLRHWEVCED